MNPPWIHLRVGYSALQPFASAPTSAPSSDVENTFKADNLKLWSRGTTTAIGDQPTEYDWAAKVLEYELNDALQDPATRLVVRPLEDRCYSLPVDFMANFGYPLNAQDLVQKIMSGRPGVTCKYTRDGWIDEIGFRVMAEQADKTLVPWQPSFVPADHFVLASLTWWCLLAQG